jgi:hypothetical protein
MALADASKIIGRFGITGSTIIPFGFKDAYFYDQIQLATGTLHVFTYTFNDDVVGFFAAWSVMRAAKEHARAGRAAMFHGATCVSLRQEKILFRRRCVNAFMVAGPWPDEYPCRLFGLRGKK